MYFPTKTMLIQGFATALVSGEFTGNFGENEKCTKYSSLNQFENRSSFKEK